MNALVVLDLNSFLPPMARASFEHAAKRWGVEFVRITEPILQQHHFWEKAAISTLPHVTAFERVLQLDGDMLIRSDCPNPFDKVPAENFGVVSRIQPGRPKWLSKPNCGKRFAHLYGLKPYDRPQEHLNAGFILYNPTAHKDILTRWREAGEYCNWRSAGFPEQMALSCLLHQYPERTTWLPWQFNACSIDRRKRALPQGAMRAYIYHFHRPRPGGLLQYMAHYQWQL